MIFFYCLSIILVDQNARAHGLESESETAVKIEKKMMTGTQGITRIEVEDLTEGGTSLMAIAAIELKISTG